MKFVMTAIAVCLSCASWSNGALAQNAVTLTQKDPQGLFWDAGNSQHGQTALQLYQTAGSYDPSQAFTWTPASGGFTVCSLRICLSDNGGGSVVMSSKADVFNITNQGAVIDLKTHKYVVQPSNAGNGSFLLMGTTPQEWTFAFAAGGSSVGGGGGGSSSPVSIMPLGDSITEGYAAWTTFIDGGYRCPLYSLLKGSGVNFSYVGNSAYLEPGLVTACPDVHWEGHGGYDISSIQGFEDADRSVQSSQPGIVLLLGGTNDVAQGEASSVAWQLKNILNDIFAKDPNAWVIISTIPPMNPWAPSAPSGVAYWAPQVPGANAQIRAVAAEFHRTTLVDFYSAAVGNVGANIGTDGVHPSVAGYAILANLWYKAITAHLAQ